MIGNCFAFVGFAFLGLCLGIYTDNEDSWRMNLVIAHIYLAAIACMVHMERLVEKEKKKDE